MASTYAQLKLDVADFMHRTDLDPKMDIFVELAEAMINKDLRAMEMESRLPVVFTDTFYPLPADILELRAVQVNAAGRRLAVIQMTPQQLDVAFSFGQGAPKAFAIHGNEIEFRPGFGGGSPPVTYDGELSYYKRVDTLTLNPTNKVLALYPMIYLSAMMVQANMYVQDDKEMQKWIGTYALHVDQANKQAGSARNIVPTVRGT